MAYLFEAISAGMITVIGGVSPMATELHFLNAPHVHTDLGGTPVAIIGNSSNKIGKFSCIKIEISSFQIFPYIATQKS